MLITKNPIKNILSNKLEDAANSLTNSINILVVFSIIYEEIFNTIIRYSKLVIRNKIQPSGDIFYYTNNHINNIIIFEFDLISYNCKTKRARKVVYNGM